MPEHGVVAHAEIRLWGGTVGAVAELEGGRILFEYAGDFRGRGLEISPIHVPTARRGPLGFDELRRGSVRGKRSGPGPGAAQR